ncbi:Phosphoadenosine phosphosulfate reductase [Geodia barretti]|uniref:Phosphoadenosine phosphosulfate reductase n=1 Tax=Geodia barretti TaxID=519541 RepID=A0AA35WR01_GEOBA|nr:Phosphoadenosine phosphosulfate reductase [Geodia barretti]
MYTGRIGYPLNELTNQDLINEELCYEVRLLEEPQEILFNLIKRFKERAAIVTSGQLSGMILLHMAYENKLPFRACTIDTLRLFPETYEFFDHIEAHYNIRIERITPEPEAVDRMVANHGEFLFFDSKQKQEYCCNIRKVEPMQRLLDTLDVWFSGLRRDQSSNRQSTPKAEIIEHKGRSILKVNPLADWPEARIWEYIHKHDIPVNPLMEPQKYGQYYESLGCVICTTPILPGEPKRAGRWRWQNAPSSDEENKKECGIHYAI